MAASPSRRPAPPPRATSQVTISSHSLSAHARDAVADAAWSKEDEEILQHLDKCCGVIMAPFTPDDKKIDESLADEMRQYREHEHEHLDGEAAFAL